jgi:branched-chain amino acid transport system ATP-binding protein
MLTLDKVTVRFGELTILRALSAKIPEGIIAGLVGRNGAGKTTTLKSVIGLLNIVSGNIRLNEDSLQDLSPRERVKLGLGYMPEDRRLIGPLSVAENLLLPMWAIDEKDDQGRLETIYDLLPEVKDMEQRKANQLSGGQQRLVALARSFFTGHRLLLLDEPLEGVAPLLARRLGEVIREFLGQEPGLSIIVAESSDLKRITALTDKIFTIERGEIISEN